MAADPIIKRFPVIETLHLIFLATTQCDHGRATGDQFGRSTTAAAILTHGRLRSRGEPSGACDLDRLTPSVRLLPSGRQPARWKRAAASGPPYLWDFRRERRMLSRNRKCDKLQVSIGPTAVRA